MVLGLYLGFNPGIVCCNRVYKLGHGGLGGRVLSLNFAWRQNGAVIDGAFLAARLTVHTKQTHLSALVYQPQYLLLHPRLKRFDLLSIPANRFVPQNMHFCLLCDLSFMSFYLDYLHFKG